MNKKKIPSASLIAAAPLFLAEADLHATIIHFDAAQDFSRIGDWDFSFESSLGDGKNVRVDFQ